MSSIEFIYFSVVLVAVFVAMILFVLFGQVTVRKLRKNPETKEALGIEFTSGWDILNVASALAIPKWLNRKFKASSLAAFAADAELLYKHTSSFDRFLAKLFYSFYVFAGTSLILLMLLDIIGIFD